MSNETEERRALREGGGNGKPRLFMRWSKMWRFLVKGSPFNWNYYTRIFYSLAVGSEIERHADRVVGKRENQREMIQRHDVGW